MKSFAIRAKLRVPIILKGYTTLDALLMSILGKGDVSNLLKCMDDLYFASAALPEDLGITQKASFVASMRPEQTPEWRDIIKPNTNTEGLPTNADLQGSKRLNDLKIGLARQREAGNILSSYSARYTPSVEWHAIGIGEAVYDVLKETTFLGKRRTAGYGEEDEWCLR